MAISPKTLTFLKRLLTSLPILSTIGIYRIVHAQWEWFDQPYISEKSTFMLALTGMILVFSQGWYSRRDDWQPIVNTPIESRHLLNSSRWWLGLIGLCACIVGIWHGISNETWRTQPTILLCLGGFGLIFQALIPNEHWRYYWQLLRRKDESHLPINSLSWRNFTPFAQWIIALIGIGLCLYVSWRAELYETHVVYLLKLWGLGLTLTILGLVPITAQYTWVKGIGRSLKNNKWEWTAILIITLIGGLVRFMWLETQPHIQSDDEAAFAIQAVDLVGFSKWIDNPFRYGSWQSHPLLFHLTQTAAIQNFGQTVAAARMPSAVMGTLTIPAVYLLGRRVFNWRVGIVAAIFMTTFPIHVHFSRLGLNQVGDPFFVTLSLAFLIGGIRSGNQMEYALAGLTLGLSQYFYSGARLIPILMLGFVGLTAILNFRWFRRQGDLLAIMVILAGVTTFPNLYSTHLDKERPFSPRLDHVGIANTGDVQNATSHDRLEDYWEYQFAHSFGAYTHRMDESGFFGIYQPVMGWYGGIPLMIGVAICLRRWRDSRWLIFPLWVAGSAILGGVLLVDPPHFTRYASATPSLAILVGVGLVYVMEMIQDLPLRLNIWEKWSKTWSKQWLRTVTLLGVVIGIGALNIFDYSLVFLPQKLYFGIRTENLNIAVRELIELDTEDKTIFYFSDGGLNLHGSSLVRYQLGQRGREYLGTVEDIHDLPAGDYVFVAAASRFDEIEAIANEVSKELQVYETATFDPLIYVLMVSLPESVPQN